MPTTSPDAERRCANPDCRIAETGRCIEGLELSACPHYGRELDSGDESEEPSASATTAVALASAGALTPEVASEVLRHHRAQVVAVVGPSDSGKTSLIASLYDLFQEGHVSGLAFARSTTLHAFEQTCHDARSTSRRSSPHMMRTPLGEVRFYHLETRIAASGQRVVLLIGDRAGEEYREASDDVSLVAGFSELRRADVITVLVDGSRLLGAARHNVRHEIIMILQALQDGSGFQPGVALALVLTKLDDVQRSPEASRALGDFRLIDGDVRRIFGASFGAIKTFEVAASPKTAAVPRGTGVADLVSFWAAAAVPIRHTNSDGFAELDRAFVRLRALEAVEPGNA